MLLRAHILALIGLFAANLLVTREAAGASPEAAINCGAQRPEEARSLAEVFMKQADYQRAGQCYLALGEYDLANRAFLRATRPTAEATRRAAIAQGEAPQALAQQLKSSFHTKR